ncbi:hypothetical protein EJ357_24015 [Streptomyces cyaneochromogenes]|uniref:Uncharacterized protein n=1 Tax=Streptomyces cyaneochromogenes TaxID=2496836 RepID=A0A3S9MAI2_9ACTN|nr:hypothetical protein EJ357_24015 [Streptomyces cyaneochromogenes]
MAARIRAVQIRARVRTGGACPDDLLAELNGRKDPARINDLLRRSRASKRWSTPRCPAPWPGPGSRRSRCRP